MTTSENQTARRDGSAAMRRYGIVATVAGLVAIVAALATPLLPVNAQQSRIMWPSGAAADENGSVVAPLTAQTAGAIDVSVDCRILRDAAAGGHDTVIVSTAPSSAPRSIRKKAMAITAGSGTANITVGDTVLARADSTALTQCSSLVFRADPTAMSAHFIGAGEAVRGDPAERPTVAGLFTDLSPATLHSAGGPVRVRVDVDDSFNLARTALKTAVIVIGVLAALLSLFALARLDTLTRGRRALGRRLLVRLAAPRPVDLVVTAALVVWHFLGAGTSDDGYIQVMGRNAGDAGYLADYYRFFGAAEAPFDWYYSFLSHWAGISSAGIWMRLPALVAGLLSWFVLSRVLLPRLGARIGGNRWAVVGGAAVFVAFWVAFCSGLRPEPIIVLGSLLTWWLVESAIASRRLLPAALATFCALATLATGPQGIVAIAVLIAGSRPMLRIVLSLRRRSGLLPLLASLASAVSLLVFLVFRTQTLATVAEAVGIRTAVGPTLSWSQELMRYYFLTLGTPDAALAKRIPILLMIIALGVTVALMLRRHTLSGVSRGPVWRLIGTVLLTLGLFSFVPTKWTVQFGVFAGLAAALTAVSIAVLVAVAGQSARAVWVYLTVLAGACAVATAGNNAWGWAYDFGIPWFDKAPVLAGRSVSTLFLALTGVCFAILLWVSVRPDRSGSDPHRRDERLARRRRLTVAIPALAIAALLVVAEFAMFARAAVARMDTYTTFSANVRALTGDACGMADRVLVEADPNANMLTPVGTTSSAAALAAEHTGFTPNGVAPDLTPEAIRLGAGTIHTAPNPGRPYLAKGASEGTGGGTGPRGVNGSTVALPFGLDPATTPVLGSYGYDNGTATLVSGWYRLPERSASPLIVLSAAGSIFSITRDGAPIGGRDLHIEFGTDVDGAFRTVGEPVVPIDPTADANRPWRNLRIPMGMVPAAATTMRIVARDANLSPDEWLAVTPPRAPQLQTLQQVVGSDDPVLLDLSVGSQFPCQQPMTASHGVFTVPQWRITPNRAVTFSKSKSWQAASAGGVLAVTESLTRSSTVATYLENDWYRDWGNLLKLTALVPGARPAPITTTVSRQAGWHTTGSVVTGGSDD